MIAVSQAEVVTFLTDRETHATAATVEVVETHAAYVFLVDDKAYKIKRAVRYDYLDYSTLARRHAALTRELELNRPAAPTIYRDVVPITRSPDGRLQIDGTGQPVEWVLHMARFRAEDELANVAARGDLDTAMAEALGQSIARYHARAERRAAKPGPVLVKQILDELAREFAGLSDTLPADETDAFLDAARKHLDRAEALLAARTVAGHVRRCHGDLHLRNIVLIDGAPVPFDALEFDEELGTCDVLYDLAFLLMDLHHRGLEAAANAALNAYLRAIRSAAELTGLKALPLFLGLRAAINAMVAVQTARARNGDEGLHRDARHYLADARAALVPAPAALIAVGGLSGTGKTTLARALALRIGPMPGAVHLRSDLERKAMLGVAPLTRLPDTAYAPDISARVYDRLAQRARITAQAGHAVVVDAACLRPEHRATMADVARACGVPFAGLWLEADADILFARVAARHGDASDADARVVQMQLARNPAVFDWDHVAAAGTPSETLDDAMAVLSAKGLALRTSEP